MVGPFLKALGNKRFLIVITNYFTKWVEAASLNHIRDTNTKRFVWKNIVTRFRIPCAPVLDKGTQFNSEPFKYFYEHLGIQNY